MRHLIDTYIEAAEPRNISPFDNMGLLDLIMKTGIANAIATQLGGATRTQSPREICLTAFPRDMSGGITDSTRPIGHL